MQKILRQMFADKRQDLQKNRRYIITFYWHRRKILPKINSLNYDKSGILDPFSDPQPKPELISSVDIFGTFGSFL